MMGVRGRWHAAPVLIAAMALGVSPSLGQVRARISRVGLSAGGAQLVRDGAWSFVEVVLSHGGSGPFAGVLEVRQPDRDGDIALSRTPVALAPGGEPRPYAVYFVASSAGTTAGVTVRLMSDEGRMVPMVDEVGATRSELTSDMITLLGQETGIVLDLSTPPIPLLVARPSSGDARRGEESVRWEVRPLDPRSLPTRWIGLELADAIVMDDPDPTQLESVQIEALIDWVRFGGRLVLGVSRNAAVLMQSPLADILPATILGTERASEVQEFSQKILEDTSHDLDAYYAARPVLRCRMRPLPGAVSVPASASRLQGLDPLIYRVCVGRGTVTLVGASLRELLAPLTPKTRQSGTGDEPEAEESDAGNLELQRARVLERVVGISRGRRVTDPAYSFVSLFDVVRSTIGFQRVGSAYLLAAVLFAAGYALTASLGTWTWLRRRQMVHHAWSAYTIVAVAATLVGGAAVIGLRGVRTQMEQTTIVDGQADSGLAVATCLFGVKTPNHARLDARLPNGSGADDADVAEIEGYGSLRVLPPDTTGMFGSERFVAPLSYAVTGGGQALNDLPVRATLKELEGFWEGSLPGRLEAELHMTRARVGDGTVERFTRGTRIRNRLGVELRECHLLETSDEFGALRDISVRCYYVGQLAASGPGSELDENSPALRANFYGPADPSDRSKGEVELTRSQIRTLAVSMREWCSGLMPQRIMDGSTGLGSASGRDVDAIRALLLLSGMTTYDPANVHGTQTHVGLLRGGGRRLDALHQLSRRHALLIGFSDRPPPVSLRLDGRSAVADRALTMYRFVIPVERGDRGE